MSDAESNLDLEKLGVELAEQGQYAKARNIFERILTTKTVPLHKAQVLRSIMLTYDKEGNKAAAIETANEILSIPDLCNTNHGIYLHGQITGYLRRLQRSSIWSSPNFLISFAAYCSGASLGAIFGSKIQLTSHMLSSLKVFQDLRYIGACLGALVGLFFLNRLAAQSGRSLCIICGVIGIASTAYLLLQNDLLLGLIFLLGILVVIPVLLQVIFSVLLRS